MASGSAKKSRVAKALHRAAPQILAALLSESDALPSDRSQAAPFSALPHVPQALVRSFLIQFGS